MLCTFWLTHFRSNFHYKENMKQCNTLILILDSRVKEKYVTSKILICIVSIQSLCLENSAYRGNGGETLRKATCKIYYAHAFFVQ